MTRYRTALAIAALFLFSILATASAVFAKGSVLGSPHNLSVSGGGGSEQHRL